MENKLKREDHEEDLVVNSTGCQMYTSTEGEGFLIPKKKKSNRH